jgi:glycine cleavage system H protein
VVNRRRESSAEAPSRDRSRGDGWLFRMEVSEESELGELLDADAYSDSLD